MATETERKFLVKDTWQPVGEGHRIAQGYLFSDENKTVRVRLMDTRGFLTVKGRTEGISREEFEYEIPAADAEKMLTLCSELVEKTRYVENVAGKTWEIDVFAGDNAPLILAEIELATAEESFDKPSWAGEEVSFDKRYFNAYLARCPYGAW